MKKPAAFYLALLVSGILFSQVRAQEFIPLWPDNRMPNSRGMDLADSVSNERVHQVGSPGMYAFFPSRQENKRCAVVIIPGGGYIRLAYNISGFQLAKWFNTFGVTAFVLNHRLPTSPDLIDPEKGPVQDAQRAFRVIRSRAEEWALDSDKIGVMGSSAGGHLASTVSVLRDDLSALSDPIDTVAFRPDFTILISPVINMFEYAHVGSRTALLGEDPSEALLREYSTELRVDETTPPAFIVHAANDRSVHPMNSILYYQAMLEHDVSGSLHIFPRGGHSIALRNNPGSANSWSQLCEEWLMEMNFLNTLK